MGCWVVTADPVFIDLLHVDRIALCYYPCLSDISKGARTPAKSNLHFAHLRNPDMVYK